MERSGRPSPGLCCQSFDGVCFQDDPGDSIVRYLCLRVVAAASIPHVAACALSGYAVCFGGFKGKQVERCECVGVSASRFQ